MLFSQVTKATSGPVSRYLNARMSIPVSKLLIETGISPHLVTVLFVMPPGLAGAWLISRPDEYLSFALAGVLWQLAAVLDRCDGEIARVQLSESKFGAWFDTLHRQFRLPVRLRRIPVRDSAGVRGQAPLSLPRPLRGGSPVGDSRGHVHLCAENRQRVPAEVPGRLFPGGSRQRKGVPVPPSRAFGLHCQAGFLLLRLPRLLPRRRLRPPLLVHRGVVSTCSRSGS